MAMSRSLGGTSLTIRSPMRITPEVDLFQPRDHPQRRGLAASRRPDEHDKFPIGDAQIDRIDGFDAAGVDLGDFLELNASHGRPEYSGLSQPRHVYWRR